MALDFIKYCSKHKKCAYLLKYLKFQLPFRILTTKDFWEAKKKIGPQY